MIDEIFNEQVKSTSAWLNQLATGVVVVGGLPVYIYGLYNLRADGATFAAIAYAIATGVMLHSVARDTLGRLRI